MLQGRQAARSRLGGWLGGRLVSLPVVEAGWTQAGSRGRLEADWQAWFCAIFLSEPQTFENYTTWQVFVVLPNFRFLLERQMLGK